ncbi:MAG: hypothetical protein GY847_20770 [Proteobacteria bacterium]|nr:hypothetical protein [Pseudomonadota bacterium]
MPTLGSLLVQNQVMGVTEIERALQHQVIYGGDLATNMLELSLVDETVITEYAARSLELPILMPNLVEDAEIRAIKLMPWTTVKTYRVLPIKIEASRMIVAISTPLSDSAMEEISFRLDVELVPHFILDFRLAMGLNLYYGIPLSPRLRDLQHRFAPHFNPSQPPVVMQPSGEHEVYSGNESQKERVEVTESISNNRLEIDTTKRIFTMPKVQRNSSARQMPFEIPVLQASETKKDASEKETVKPLSETETFTEEARVSPEALLKKDKKTGYDVGSMPPEQPSAQPIFSLEEAQEQLNRLHDRNSILNLVMDCASKVFEFVVLMVVDGGVARGKSVISRTEKPSGIDNVAIALDRGGMFQTVFETRAFHLGPLGTSEVEEEALNQMGRKWPHSCAILPVLLRHRIILMIYGDSGDAGVQADQVSEFVRFTRVVGDAFEKILIEQKYGKESSVPSPVAAKTRSSVPVSPRTYSQGPAKGAGIYYKKGDENQNREPEPMLDKVPDTTSRMPTRPAPQLIDIYKDMSNGRRSEDPPGVDSWTDTLEKKDSGVPLSTGGDVKEKFRKMSTGPTPMSDPSEKRRQTRNYDEISTDSDDHSLKAQKTRADAQTDSTKGQAVVSRSVISITNRGAAPTTAVAPKMSTKQSALSNRSSDVVTTAEILSIKSKEPPRSVVVEMKEEIDRLVERIMSPGRFDQTAADLLVGIGDDALDKLIRKFPGPLLCDRYQEAGKLPRAAQHGPLVKTMLMFEEKAVPYLLPMFDSLDSGIRFYAVFMFSELLYPRALGALTTRLFDNDRQIRALAVDVLKGFKKFPEYRWAMREVVNVLKGSKSGLDAKRIAAEALGELGEPSAVSGLAEMLASVDGVLVERCHRALVKITFSDFGFSAERWLSWLGMNRQKHRIEWAISSMAHPKEPIRIAAIRELKSVVGHVVKWPQGPMDHKHRLDAQKQLREWWKREGMALYPIEESD